MKARGMGRVFQPTYRDQRTGELKTAAVWTIRYSVRGKRFEESSGSRNRADAVRLLKKRLGEAGTGHFLGPDVERTTVDELAEMLKTDYRINGRKSFDRIQDAIGHFLGSFGGLRAIDLTGDKISRYVEARQENEAANGTINRELAALKRAFRLGVQAGKVAQCPYIPMLKESPPRQGFFTEADVQALLTALPPDLQPLFECAYLTGWRVASELAPLQWSHVDFAAGTLRLDGGTTKNGEARVYPFFVRPRLESLFRQQRERTEALSREQGQIIRWVFSRNGEPIRDFRGAWDAACKEIGLPDRTPHDLRRSAVRDLEHSGVPRSIAMKLVGHRTESVYQRYAVMFEDDLAKGVSKLAALDEVRTVVPLVDASSREKIQKGRVGGEWGEVISRQQSRGDR